MRALGSLVVMVVAACSSSTSGPSAGSGGANAPSVPPSVSPSTAPSPSSSGRSDVPAAVRDAELATSAQVVVLKGVDVFAEYRDVVAAAQKLDRSVVAAPFAFGEVSITLAAKTVRVRVKGVDPKRATTLYRLAGFVDDAKSLEGFATPSKVPPILVGRALIKELYAYTGAKVTLAGAGGTRVVQIAGVFHLDNDVLDQLVLAPFADVHGLLGRGDTAMGVDITLSDVDRSAEFAKQLGTALGGSYKVLDWYELHHQSTAAP